METKKTNQRLQFFFINKIEISYEIVEVLVASVDMSLLKIMIKRKTTYRSYLMQTIEVVNIDVHKHSEQPTKYFLYS